MREWLLSKELTSTCRERWLETVGPDFQKMMTGDFGSGPQHISFAVEDRIRDPERPRHDASAGRQGGWLQSVDLDSVMGWLNSLVISTRTSSSAHILLPVKTSTRVFTFFFLAMTSKKHYIEYVISASVNSVISLAFSVHCMSFFRIMSIRKGIAIL